MTHDLVGVGPCRKLRIPKPLLTFTFSSYSSQGRVSYLWQKGTRSNGNVGARVQILVIKDHIHDFSTVLMSLMAFWRFQFLRLIISFRLNESSTLICALELVPPLSTRWPRVSQCFVYILVLPTETAFSLGGNSGAIMSLRSSYSALEYFPLWLTGVSFILCNHIVALRYW